MDDKQPSENHDFSDFDDLFAEQDDALDHDFEMEGNAHPASDNTTTNAEPSQKSNAAPQTDAVSENTDVTELLDDAIATKAPDNDSLLENDPMDAGVFDDGNLIDDEAINTDASMDEAATTEANSPNPPNTSTDKELDDKEEADTASPSEQETVKIATDESPPNDRAIDDTISTTEHENNDLVMHDDDFPDIDFAKNGGEENAAQAVDDIIDELESFDDFVIDDGEPTITPEFGKQAALDPIEQPETEHSDPLQAIEESDDPWADEKESAPSPAQDSIVPEQLNEAPKPLDPEIEPEEEEESMKQSNMIALIAGAVALLASMGGLWLGYSAKAELAQLPVQAGGNSVLNNAKLKAIDEKMSQVDERIIKLSTKLASFGAMSGGSSDPKVDELDTRTARLEQLMSNVKEEIGHLSNNIKRKIDQLNNTITAIKKQPAPVRRVVKRKPRPKPTSKPFSRPTPAVNHQGKWFVNLTSHSNLNNAKQQVQQMKALGIAAESKQVVVKGRTYFRVRIAGFATKAQSNAFKSMLTKKHHITDSWISNH